MIRTNKRMLRSVGRVFAVLYPARLYSSRTLLRGIHKQRVSRKNDNKTSKNAMMAESGPLYSERPDIPNNTTCPTKKFQASHRYRCTCVGWPHNRKNVPVLSEPPTKSIACRCSESDATNSLPIPASPDYPCVIELYYKTLAGRASSIGKVNIHL